MSAARILGAFLVACRGANAKLHQIADFEVIPDDGAVAPQISEVARQYADHALDAGMRLPRANARTMMGDNPCVLQ